MLTLEISVNHSDGDKVVPKVAIGQTFKIAFKEEEQKFGQRRFKTVRLEE